MSGDGHGRDWLVQVPLDDLLALRQQAQGETEAQRQVAQLRREVEGLRSMVNDCMNTIGELRRELRER